VTSPAASVLCFGEILWDFLPDGLYPGGAPFNVAYHLHQLGQPAQVVSAVGRDLLGDELLLRLQHWGLPIDGVARDADRPTGFVRARVGAGGDARYEIAPDVAWDRIPVGEEIRRTAGAARALVFESLAQRSPSNRAALDLLISALPANALRVFDVNLRPPHDDLTRARALACRATVFKLNAAEAARLAGGTGEPAHEEDHARTLREQTGCPLVCVTSGARGAGLLRAERWIWEPGRPVEVVDTVGAGDAFLAALVRHLVDGRIPDTEVLARACRLGEWVASRRGATPGYDSAAPTV
jgi:fructokinase